jgi:fluoride exporter
MVMELWNFLLVMLGGGVGAGVRYAVGRLLATWTESFPWHTLLINVVGSLLLSLLVSWAKVQPERTVWLLLFGTGVCGGFTTFSTFSVETIALLQEERFLVATVYVLASVFGALGGAWLGTRL